MQGTMNPAHYLVSLRQRQEENHTFMPMRLRSSRSGSAHQVKNVMTSLAIWLVVAGVPAE